MDMENLPEKVLKYETFVNETLRNDLKKVLEQRDKLYDQTAELLQLKTVIERLQEGKMEEEEIKTKVDLGCNFYVQARVPDASRIYVCVGFGFYVEFTLQEALCFIDKKVKHLTDKSDGLTKDAGKIKAHIKLMLEGLREIQHIDSKLPESPRRDLFT